jgi:prepilin-type N-terminal cleavage/methylation domain-containing protein
VRGEMPTYRVGRSNEPRGFTLVELAVVLMILAVVLGLVLPEVSSFLFRSDLKASSRRLAGAVSYTRSQAMLEGRLWELTLDLDTASFWATALDKEGSSSDLDTVKKRTLAGDVRFMDVKKLPDEMIRAGRVVLHFHPKGLVEPAVIHLAGPGKQIQTLFVKAFNGRLVARDGYLEENG